MDEVAPTDMKKAVAFNSSGSMSESSFLAFLNAVADLVEKGMLDRKYLEWAQFSLESHLSGFLVKHHDQPEVRDIILRSRKIFEDIPGKVASYDAMLTGESKKKIENYEARLAPPSSDQMTRHESDGKRPASNRVTSPPMGDERTSIEPGGSSVGNELSLPSPPPPTPVRRANGFVWPMLGVAMAFLAAVAVWLLRRR
jgi:hypothetical protein